ncbi:hypothetical protein B2G71_15065 [Novosphingobium sp. PC22D]|uniref:FecR family protein n=1 Tax=Novosphingobium sp. PC22D TaxID=1962403 RepID=UPI000BEF903E|nr:FecR domain-containing protein [Novosphingobium sp. PC22D]PEQ11769.1 hypothetical protein B2G71_15065 [Novosphingobium sp. PC22D]
MSKFDRTEEAAARWLIRYEESDWTDADQAELDSWLSADVEHKVAFWRLKDAWTKGDRLASRRADTVTAERQRPKLHRYFQIAAGLAAVLVAAILLVPAMLGNGELFETAKGVQQTVLLADGSQMELNTATRLRADLAGARREVWLDSGEAYFEVVHNPRRPFVVHAGSHDVKVLGTRFSVRRDGDAVQVAVLQGRVRLDDIERAKPSSSAVLTAGAIARTDDAGVLIRQASAERVQDDLGWREGLLVFDQTTLEEAVAEFNRYNGRQLVIADPAVAAIRIGGRLQARNVDGFTRLLERIYGLKVETDGNLVTISK